VGSQNVEIVRRLYECFRERDNETPFKFFDLEIEWDMRESEIPGLDHVYRGHEGVRDFWRGWLEAWDEIEFAIDDPVELDDGTVQVLVRQRNRGRGTGIWIDQSPYHHRWTLSGGRVTRVEFSWAEGA
jgi:ketosteroid isomerase-like protein